MLGDPMLQSVVEMSDRVTEARRQDAAESRDQQGGGGGAPEEGEAAEGEEVQDNGTNPASFGFKFMPYYRYTELNNGVKSIENLTLFALIDLPKISPFSALVLEWPVSKTFDGGALAEGFLTNLPTPESPELPEGAIPIPCGPPICAAPRVLPVQGLARGFDITGVGDFRLRYLQGIKMFPGKKPGASTVLMVGLDVMTPAASDPILGDETWYGSPIFAHIHNLNPESFFAFLHFYFFDWAEKSGADPLNQDKKIGFYMGRFFFQKAWSKSGYYMLPEMQVIYDNESENDWSVMFMPEFGKSFAAGSNLGMTAYIKPGWAIDGPDAGERRFSVEFGIRMIPMGK
jgi:hypothetical protein